MKQRKKKTPPKHRPMPKDPKELAKAMFDYADQKMFGGRTKKEPPIK